MIDMANDNSNDASHYSEVPQGRLMTGLLGDEEFRRIEKEFEFLRKRKSPKLEGKIQFNVEMIPSELRQGYDVTMTMTVNNNSCKSESFVASECPKVDFEASLKEGISFLVNQYR